MNVRIRTVAMALGIASPGFLLMSAPVASADCVNAGNSTVCAQGTVSGGGPTPPSAGPYMPYPCDYDYLCNAGLSIELGPIDRPDHPNRPIRPNRPGGGGGRN